MTGVDGARGPVGARERRLALGLSQAALAETMGVTQMAVAKWETRGLPAARDAQLAQLEHAAEQAVDDTASPTDALPADTAGVVAARRQTRARREP